MKILERETKILIEILQKMRPVYFMNPMNQVKKNEDMQNY